MPAFVVAAAPNMFGAAGTLAGAGTAAFSMGAATAGVAAGSAAGAVGLGTVFASNPVGWAAVAGIVGMKVVKSLFGGGSNSKVQKEISAMRDDMRKQSAFDATEGQRRHWSMEKAMANAIGGGNTFRPRPTEPAPVVGGGLQNQYMTPQGDTNWEYMYRRMISDDVGV